MKNFVKKLMLVMSVVILTLPIFTSTVQAESTVEAEPEINATAGMIFDEHTGQIVYKKNADEKVAIGSITKIVTCI